MSPLWNQMSEVCGKVEFYGFLPFREYVKI